MLTGPELDMMTQIHPVAVIADCSLATQNHIYSNTCTASLESLVLFQTLFIQKNTLVAIMFQLLMQLAVHLQTSHPKTKGCNKSGLIFLLQRKCTAGFMSLPRAMTGRAHWPTGNCSLQQHCAKQCLDNLSKAVSTEMFYIR